MSAKELFKLNVSANGTEYESTGETISEALNNLPVNGLEIKTKGTVRISQGKRTAERFLFLKQIRPLFLSKLRKIAFAKQLGDLLEASK